jgi:hypothetical protein
LQRVLCGLSLFFLSCGFAVELGGFVLLSRALLHSRFRVHAVCDLFLLACGGLSAFTFFFGADDYGVYFLFFIF